MNVEELDYHLPQDRIAQFPARRRDQSRLMVLRRDTGELWHGRFKDIVKWVQKGDLIVVNDTRVIPARIFGVREDTGGRVEVLLCQPLSVDRRPLPPIREVGAFKANTWECMVRVRGHIGPSTEIDFGDGIQALITRTNDGWVAQFEGTKDILSFLRKKGQVPLPPYVSRRADMRDARRYQTVFARREGSIAAPTAGLHFNRTVLKALESRGVRIATVTLQIGPGTFRPIRAAKVEDHRIHPEYIEINEECCRLWQETRNTGGRVIAVGTTVVRALESAVRGDGTLMPYTGFTSLYILPGHEFRAIDAMVTNFHLPRTTLLAMVMAFAGREKIMKAYSEAVRLGYRFYSYGDAMFIC